MSDPTLEINKALIAAIRAEASLVALFGSGELFPARADGVSVWDAGPPDLDPGDGEEGYPFIRVGEFDAVSDERVVYAGGVVDDPSDVTATIHVFARGESRNVIARTISKGIRRAIGRELELGEGFKNTLGLVSSVRHYTESDGLTAHTVVTARYYVEAED